MKSITKIITKNLMYLQLTALCLTAAFAGPGAADKAVPFKGSIQAVETSVAEFPTLFVDASGFGKASHLGRFTVTYQFEVNIPTSVGIGSAHFIAANGDGLLTEVTGVGTEPDPFSFIVEMHTIIGGTGRFAGATGSFTVERLLNAATGVTSGSFTGTISY